MFASVLACLLAWTDHLPLITSCSYFALDVTAYRAVMRAVMRAVISPVNFSLLFLLTLLMCSSCGDQHPLLLLKVSSWKLRA